jgi:hypothetical protein
MQNLHALTVRYFGATNSNGSRVRITSARFKQAVTIPFDYSKNHILDMAEEWLISKGFTCLYTAEVKEGYIILSDTFKPFRVTETV